jgi:hypothetical protein
VPDRLPGGEGVAEITPRQIADVTDELDVKRLVEAELDADLLDRLLGSGRPGEVGGGITGQRTRQEKGNDTTPMRLGTAISMRLRIIISMADAVQLERFSTT